MKKESVKIVSLEAENVKRIKAINIKPDGNMVVIGGENAHGKTSVLDCIQMAMDGKRSIPPRPVRDGEKKATTVLELDNGLTVRRTFTAAGGSALTVTSGAGVKFPSPQAMLSELTGKLSFDPLAFSRMEPSKQLETLRELVGLDFRGLDVKRSVAYDDRRAKKKELADLKTRRNAITITSEKVPSMLIRPEELLDKIAEAEEHKERVVRATRFLSDREGMADDLAREREDVIGQIKELEAKAKDLEGQLETAHGYIAKARDKVTEVEKADPGYNVDDLKRKIRESQEINNEIERRKERKKLDDLIDKKQNEITDCDEDLKRYDKEKEDKIASAEFPVDGLSFGDGCVLLNGLPLEQASGAESLRVSVAIGMALNPVLRVMLVRDGSLLSNKSLASLAEMAAGSDYQIWIERVGDGDECSVVIEDGEIK